MVGPDPERRSLCHCKSCQLRTGSWFSVQARYPRNNVTIEGQSTAWKFPGTAAPVTYRSCDSSGATYHFCPVCGSTVYYELDVAPDFLGVKVGAFTDPTFPAPNIAGFEEYKFPYAMNLSELPMEHHQ
ncbi:GFA family protein [Flavitalea sp.]